jgi:hypothetical protein
MKNNELNKKGGDHMIILKEGVESGNAMLNSCCWPMGSYALPGK